MYIILTPFHPTDTSLWTGPFVVPSTTTATSGSSNSSTSGPIPKYVQCKYNEIILGLGNYTIGRLLIDRGITNISKHHFSLHVSHTSSSSSVSSSSGNRVTLSCLSSISHCIIKSNDTPHSKRTVTEKDEPVVLRDGDIIYWPNYPLQIRIYPDGTLSQDQLTIVYEGVQRVVTGSTISSHTSSSSTALLSSLSGSPDEALVPSTDSLSSSDPSFLHHYLCLPLLSINRDYDIPVVDSIECLVAALDKFELQETSLPMITKNSNSSISAAILHVWLMTEKIEAESNNDNKNSTISTVISPSSSSPTTISRSLMVQLLREYVMNKYSSSKYYTVSRLPNVYIQFTISNNSILQPFDNSNPSSTVISNVPIVHPGGPGNNDNSSVRILVCRSNWRLKGLNSSDPLTAKIHEYASTSSTSPKTLESFSIDYASKHTTTFIEGKIGAIYPIPLSPEIPLGTGTNGSGYTHIFYTVGPSINSKRPNFRSEFIEPLSLSTAVSSSSSSSSSSLPVVLSKTGRDTLGKTYYKLFRAVFALLVQSNTLDIIATTTTTNAPENLIKESSSSTPSNAFSVLMDNSKSSKHDIANDASYSPRASKRIHTDTLVSANNTTINTSSSVDSLEKDIELLKACVTKAILAGPVGKSSLVVDNLKALMQFSTYPERYCDPSFRSNEVTSSSSSIVYPVMFYNNDISVLWDAFPKGCIHLLILPRKAFIDSNAVSKLQVSDLSNLQKLQQYAQVVGTTALQAYRSISPSSSMDRMRNGSTVIHNIWYGFHIRPSLTPLHLHVISDDLSGSYMHTRKHYQTFATAFFVPLSKVIHVLEGKVPSIQKYKNNFQMMQEAIRHSMENIGEDWEQAIQQSYSCHKCHKSGTFGNFANFVDHLAICNNIPTDRNNNNA